MHGLLSNMTGHNHNNHNDHHDQFLYKSLNDRNEGLQGKNSTLLKEFLRLLFFSSFKAK